MNNFCHQESLDDNLHDLPYKLPYSVYLAPPYFTLALVGPEYCK